MGSCYKMVLLVGVRIYSNLPVVAIKFIPVAGGAGSSLWFITSFRLILRFTMLPDDADVF